MRFSYSNYFFSLIHLCLNRKIKLQILREYLEFPETASVSKECLCGNHMRGSKRTQKIKDWFNSKFSESHDKAFASDDDYAALVAR